MHLTTQVRQTDALEMWNASTLTFNPFGERELKVKMGRRTGIHNICMIKYKIDYEGKGELKISNSL